MGSQTRLPPDPATRIGPLRPGDPRRVGGYRLTGLLGEGGMGQVFLGRSRAGRVVAVKLIRPEYARQPTFRARFAREIAAARLVGGFHTVQVIDADPRAERPWMVTAYIPAPSLQIRVDTRGPLSTARVAELGAHLAEGLAAIHACGLVHRDLKPGNVLLAADGARIIDFGIARAVGAMTLTTAGTMLGTCLYMSPEQMLQASLTPASDIFSLGSVLVFAATGAPPFPATTLPAIVRDITNGAPDLTDVPRPLLPLIATCLAKDPAARPAANDILKRCAALTRRPPARQPDLPRHLALSRPPPPPRQPAPPGKPAPSPVPRRLLLAGGATAIVAAAAAFPLEFLTGQARTHSAGPASPARSAAPPRPVPAISRALVSGPSRPVSPGPVSAVLSPDGSTVAFTTADSGGAQAWLLDTSDLHVAARITLGHGPSAIAFSPDGRSLAVLGFAGQPPAARLWRLEAVGSTALNLVTTAVVPQTSRAPHTLGAAVFSPDGGTLAVAGDGGLSLLDAATLRTMRTVAAPPGVPVYRPDGKVIAVASPPAHRAGRSVPGTITLLDATTLATLIRQSVPALDAYSLTFSPDARTLALTGHGQATGGVVRLLDATSLRTLSVGTVSVGALPAVTATAAGFTPDGTILAGYSLASPPVAWLMQLSTMQIIASTPIGPPADITRLTASLSTDGRTLMTTRTSGPPPASLIALYQLEPA